jgi:hypothetical protein
VDFSTWSDGSQTTISTGDVTEPHHACEIDDVVVWSGNHVRQSAYYNGHRLSWYKKSTGTVTVKTSVLPSYMNTESSVTMRRNLLGLPNSTYSDANAEIGLQVYMTAYSKTRAQALSDITSLCRYKSGGIINYGDTTIFGLDYIGLPVLDGVRFETFIGSGVWVDKNHLNGVNPACFAIVNKTNIEGIVNSDFKLIAITGTSEDDYQRIAQTDDYVCFVRGGQYGRVWYATKSAIAIADNSVTANYVDYDFGVDGSFGDNVYFNNTGTQLVHVFAFKGNYLYATCVSNNSLGGGQFACVLRINPSANTYTIFATSSTRIVRSISIVGNNMVITEDTSMHIVDDFESLSLPIIL